MDIQQKYFNLAKEKLLLFHLSNFNYFIIVIDQVWYNDGTFDLISSYENLKLKDSNISITEIYEVQYLGGFTVISDVLSDGYIIENSKLIWKRYKNDE